MARDRLHQEKTARGILVYGQSILVSAAIDEPFWILPGGHIDPGETPLQALKREWMEEVGVSIQRIVPVAMLQTRWRRGGLLQGDLVQETLHLFWIKDLLQLPLGIFRGPESSLRFRWVMATQLITENVLPLEAIYWIQDVVGRTQGGSCA